VDDLCRITVELLAKNNDREDMYIRPIYYKSQLGIGVQLAGLEDDFLVFAVPMGPYLDLEKGLRVKVTSWRHIDDNAIPMRAKVNGAYVNAALAKSDAVLDGYDESIFLTADGHVSEGSAENLFIVRKGKLITPPVTDDILEGITRATIIELATRELGLAVIERPIDQMVFYIDDVAFIVVTEAQVIPIAKLDRKVIIIVGMSHISRMIHQLHFAVVKENLPKYRHRWQPVSNARR